jgi:hypothetical protein
MRWTAMLCVMATATPAMAQRVELPVRQVINKGGVRRFAVTVVINGQPIEAGLDTGSTGLRVLAPALPGGAGLSGPSSRYGFNAGVTFTGEAVKVAVGFGTLPAAPVRVQRIDKLDCNARLRDCATFNGDPAGFGIMGDGVAGQGFPAILGIGMRDDAVANPLVQAGVTRWIVDLPRAPGAAGRLVLNPSDGEVARYKRFRFIAGTNLVAGCITSAATRLCAPAAIDSGAVGINVQGGKDGDILPQGTPAAIVLGDRDGTVSLPVTIGRRDQASAMRLKPARADGKLTLSFGIAPYLRWSILYDARAHTIGVADATGA